MRSQHIIAMVAVFGALGFGITWLFFTGLQQPPPNAAMDVLQMQREIKNLPITDIKDPF